MICPFSGKPCLKDKETFTQYTNEKGEVMHLYLCHDCVEENADKLNIKSKSSDTTEIKMDGQITEYSVHEVTEDEFSIFNEDAPQEEPMFANIDYDYIKLVEELEAKYEESIELEDYEKAKDILKQIEKVKSDKDESA